MADDDARAEAERRYAKAPTSHHITNSVKAQERRAFQEGAEWQASRTPVVADERHASVPGIDQDDPTHPDPRWCNVCGEHASAPQHAAPVVADAETLVARLVELDEQGAPYDPAYPGARQAAPVVADREALAAIRERDADAWHWNGRGPRWGQLQQDRRDLLAILDRRPSVEVRAAPEDPAWPLLSGAPAGTTCPTCALQVLCPNPWHDRPAQSEPWSHLGHKTTQHRDGKPPWCNTCGWSSPTPTTLAALLGAPRG